MTASPALLRLAGLERFTIPGKRYPAPLPPALEANYCYTVDGGHSILVVLANEYRAGKPVADYLVPAAVRTVLRSAVRQAAGEYADAVRGSEASLQATARAVTEEFQGVAASQADLQARFAALVEKCLYRVPLAYLAGLVGLAFALGFVVRGVV